jgi:hypothetical protein
MTEQRIAEDLRELYNDSKSCDYDTDCLTCKQMMQLIERLSKAEAQLAALQWREITETELPDWAAGDEIGGWSRDGRWNIGVAGSGGAKDAWNSHGWTHFRRRSSIPPQVTP